MRNFNNDDENDVVLVYNPPGRTYVNLEVSFLGQKYSMETDLLIEKPALSGANRNLFSVIFALMTVIYCLAI